MAEKAVCWKNAISITATAAVKGNKDESSYIHAAKNLTEMLLLTLFRPSADGLVLWVSEPMRGSVCGVWTTIALTVIRLGCRTHILLHTFARIYKLKPVIQFDFGTIEIRCRRQRWRCEKMILMPVLLGKLWKGEYAIRNNDRRSITKWILNYFLHLIPSFSFSFVRFFLPNFVFIL